MNSATNQIIRVTLLRKELRASCNPRWKAAVINTDYAQQPAVQARLSSERRANFSLAWLGSAAKI